MRITFVFLLAFFLTGCLSTVQKTGLLKTPEIKSVSLKSFSAADKTAVVQLGVFNPNIYPLPVRELSANIGVNNKNIGSLAAKSNQNLAPQKTQSIDLPISLNANALSSLSQSILTTGKANYNVGGNIGTSVGSLPFKHQGQLDAKSLLKAALQ